MRSICLKLAKCRHDTLKTTNRHFPTVTRHETRRICNIFHTISPFSFYETARLIKRINSSFFEIGAFIIAFKRNINSRIYPTEKYREKDSVIRHLDALIWPTLSKRFAFAFYRPCFHINIYFKIFIEKF